MRQMHLQPVVSVIEREGRLTGNVIMRPEYHVSLASQAGLPVVWMDIAAIPDKADAMLQYRQELHTLMELAGYKGYVVNGHAQNAKTGMIPWIPAEISHPFTAQKDRVRLGALFSPCWLGVEQMRAKVLVTEDDHPGCGDGYGLWTGPVTQIRALVGTPQSKGWLDPDTVSLGKGQLGPTGLIPNGIDMVLPLGVLKGPNVPKPGTIFDAAIMLGKMNQPNRYRAGEWGYMSMQDLPQEAFQMMFEDVGKAMMNIKRFVDDPLAHLGEEWLEGIATTGYEVGEDGEAYWTDVEPTMSIRQGANWFLQFIAEVAAKTGDTRLIESAMARGQLQRAVSMLGIRASNQAGIPTVVARLIPPPAGMQVDPDDLVLHPAAQHRFPDKRGIATRFPNPRARKSQQGLKVYYDARVPNGCATMHETVCGPFSADFDGDDITILPVQGKGHWTGRLWATRRAQFLPDTEKFRAKEGAKREMDAWESCANAMRAEPGRPTDLHSDMVGSLAAKKVPMELEKDFTDNMVKLVNMIQAMVDLAKKDVELEYDCLDKGGELLKRIGWKPYWTNYRKYMKKGSKARPNSVTPTGEVLTRIHESMGTEVPYGAHSKMWLQVVPNPLVDKAGIQNVQFRDMVKPIPGPGFDEGLRLWKRFGAWMAAVRNHPEAQELKRQGAENFRAVWREISEQEDKEYVWQALSACWQEAWQDHGSILRLMDTNITELVNLVAWNIEQARLYPDQRISSGRLLKMGYDTIHQPTQFVVTRVGSIVLKSTGQEALTVHLRYPRMGNGPESAEMGPFAVMGTWVDEEAIGKLITVTPQTDKTSTFTLSFAPGDVA